MMFHSSTRINPSTSLNAPHLFFKRSSFRRPLALIIGIAVLGYGARIITVTEYKKIYDKRENERKEKVNQTVDAMYRTQHPTLDWERVMRGVLAEEERIAKEEKEASAAAALK